MKRTLAAVKSYFNSKTDENEFSALDYKIAGEPISEQFYDEAIWHAVEQYMSFSSGQDILEIGAGTGLGLKRVEPYARRLVGTDISANLLGRYRGSAETYVAAAHEADFPPETFDRIYMVSVALLFPNTAYFEKVVRLLLGQLKAGGILGIFDQYLHVDQPHPRYLSVRRSRLDRLLQIDGIDYSIVTSNAGGRRLSRRYNIIVYKG